MQGEVPGDRGPAAQAPTSGPQQPLAHLYKIPGLITRPRRKLFRFRPRATMAAG